MILQAAELDRQGLFRIERSKNANIIQYDAQVRPDGKLDKKNPVVGYWIRLAEQGQEQELTWLQNKFAFGFIDRTYKAYIKEENIDANVEYIIADPILLENVKLKAVKRDISLEAMLKIEAEYMLKLGLETN